MTLEQAKGLAREMGRDEETGERLTCNTCGRAAGSPFRVYDEHGKVINGCVDEFHTGHLVTPSESSRWHARPEAKQIRARLKRGQQGKGYGKVVSRG